MIPRFQIVFFCVFDSNPGFDFDLESNLVLVSDSGFRFDRDSIPDFNFDLNSDIDSDSNSSFDVDWKIMPEMTVVRSIYAVFLLIPISSVS